MCHGGGGGSGPLPRRPCPPSPTSSPLRPGASTSRLSPRVIVESRGVGTHGIRRSFKRKGRELRELRKDRPRGARPWVSDLSLSYPRGVVLGPCVTPLPVRPVPEKVPVTLSRTKQSCHDLRTAALEPEDKARSQREDTKIFPTGTQTKDLTFLDPSPPSVDSGCEGTTTERMDVPIPPVVDSLTRKTTVRSGRRDTSMESPGSCEEGTRTRRRGGR